MDALSAKVELTGVPEALWNLYQRASAARAGYLDPAADRRRSSAGRTGEVVLASCLRLARDASGVLQVPV